MDTMAGKFMMRLLVDSAEGMKELGCTIAKRCSPGEQIFLYGDLGAGKTTLVRGFLNGLKYHGKVKSPSYTLVESYKLPGVEVFHFDLYRINDPMELEAFGIRDYLDGQGICLFEWPEKANGLLNAPDLKITIRILGDSREVLFHPATEIWQRLLDHL